MSVARAIERRKAASQAFRLEKPLFLQVSKRIASSAFAALALIALSLSNKYLGKIDFQGIFLLICALGAWFVGNRYAVVLGLFIILIDINLNKDFGVQAEYVDYFISTTIQYGSALSVILMLGLARVALEVEWKFARIDPLTGALNRKAFFEYIEKSDKQVRTSLLIFADLDRLKKINDILGHERGDEALVRFSKRIRGVIRKNDVFARIGGDEFIIYMNVRDLAGAKEVARRLHQAVNVGADDAVDLKCSFGFLILPSGSQSIDAEMKYADKLMYKAKKENAGFAAAIAVTRKSTDLSKEIDISYLPQSEIMGARVSVEPNNVEGDRGAAIPKAA